MFSHRNRQKCPVCFVQTDKAGQPCSDPRLSIFNPHSLFHQPSTVHLSVTHPSILSIFVLSGGSSFLAFCQRFDGRVTYVALSQSRWLAVGGENTQNTANSYAYGTVLLSISSSMHQSIHSVLPIYTVYPLILPLLH